MLPLADFTTFIEKNRLFTKKDKILLAVSGGKDSVLMVQLFKLSGYQFSIAHCNFNLRNDESQRDETFVRLLAKSLEVPFYVAHFDTVAYSKTHQVSIQMAARELRYQWFETIRQHSNYNFIALAHHQSDSIETLLLNLTRGTGISGMHGILPQRDKLVRPLLFLSRSQIDKLVEINAINYVEDSSNLSSKYARNKIRLNVIPQLQEINPNLAETFAQNIARFAETEEVLQNAVAQVRADICREENESFYFNRSKINALKPQKLLLFELLKPYHFTAAVTDEILESLTKQSGTSFYSRTHRATINREELIISVITKPHEPRNYVMHQRDENILIGNWKLSILYTDSNFVEANSNKAFIAAEKLIFPLSVRFKQDGDKFMPLGMVHYKKLSDFLIDSKVPLPQKEKIPLLLNGNGEIIWVIGLRQDNRYKVKATTKKVAIFEWLNQ
ncbi:MAG: tRNA lysidine(34) synthetase TilS [Bacteroidota bacterium]